MVNFNMLTDPIVAELFEVIDMKHETVMSKSLHVDYLFDHVFGPEEKDFEEAPHSYIAEPVFESLEHDARTVGFLLALTSWANFFNKILPEKATNVHCVVSSSCGNEFTFELRGPTAVFLGDGDLHVEHYPEGMEGACVHQVAIIQRSTFEPPMLRRNRNSTRP